MKKPLFLIVTALLLSACASQPDPMEARIDAAIKLCQSDSAKAFSHTVDGLRVMCDNGSSYIIRGDISLDEIVEMDRVYCSSMGIRDFVSSNRGDIQLVCRDGASFVL